MSKAPTLRQFQAQFPNEESCLEHIMRQRFGDRHECAGCGKSAHYYRVSTRRAYVCEYCGHQVYPTAGTPFDRTRTSLRDWFTVMFMFTTTRNGVAAKAVERQIGVTYKTAWRMCHQIREYMGAVDGNGPLGGFTKQVEVDETIIGGKTTAEEGRMSNKTVVIGLMERGGKVMTKVVPNQRRATLLPVIKENVKRHSIVHTDEAGAYLTVGGEGYYHMSVNHSAGQYVGAQGTSVNSIEGFWAQLKRSINGTHIHVSQKHLSKYLGEFEYRYNMRHVPHLMLPRLMASFAR
ncbi:IS1595 family transposase [Sphingopyxis sp.]|jgi:transposase|uniref:IS1595 family transposase n=1 Tax=Sphingopyxis sp. TaxID=1908224 RepID=UPI003F6F3625